MPCEFVALKVQTMSMLVIVTVVLCLYILFDFASHDSCMIRKRRERSFVLIDSFNSEL